MAEEEVADSAGGQDGPESVEALDYIDEDLRSFEQDDMVKAALAKGVDLRQYGKSVDDELKQVERDSIMDYIAEAEELATLHTQIKQCDSILDNMESMLSGFQGDLANISAEIKHLQDESISINIRLRNRKAVEGQVRSATVSPNRAARQNGILAASCATFVRGRISTRGCRAQGKHSRCPSVWQPNLAGRMIVTILAAPPATGPAHGPVYVCQPV